MASHPKRTESFTETRYVFGVASGQWADTRIIPTDCYSKLKRVPTLRAGGGERHTPRDMERVFV